MPNSSYAQYCFSYIDYTLPQDIQIQMGRPLTIFGMGTSLYPQHVLGMNKPTTRQIRVNEGWTLDLKGPKGFHRQCPGSVISAPDLKIRLGGDIEKATCSRSGAMPPLTFFASPPPR